MKKNILIIGGTSGIGAALAQLLQEDESGHLREKAPQDDRNVR